MLRQMVRFAGTILIALSCGMSTRAFASAYATTTLTITGSEQVGDSGTLTIAFSGHSQSVSYGPYSTPSSIAAAFAAKFSSYPASAWPRLCTAGVCAKANGATITFQLKSGSFTTPVISGSTASFIVNTSSWSTPPNSATGAGQITASYTPNQTSLIEKMNSAQATDQETFLDGFGRVTRVAVSNGSGWYLTDSCYDAAGLLQFQSTPYLSSTQNPSASNCSASTATQYSYDALGRLTVASSPDGSLQTYTYYGRAVLTSNSNGVSRLMQYDLLGRLSSVCELSGGTNLIASGSPVDCGGDLAGYTGYLTTYLYDTAGGDVRVAQGDQQRIIFSDSAGRTIQVREPERGITTYNYDYNSTGLVVTRTRPAANQTNPSVTTTATTQYDNLGRPVSVVYSDGITPNNSYLYDKAYPGDLIQQKGAVKGQMSSAISVASNGTILSARELVFDQMGNITETKDCLPGWCGNAAYDVYRWYTYDLLSNLTQDQYASSLAGGSPVAVNYSYNAAGQLTQVQGGQGTGVIGNIPYSANASTMTPFGPLTTQAGNGLSTSFSYDSMGRSDRASLCSGVSSLGCSGGTSYYDVSTTMFGNQVKHSSDSVLGQQRDYSYDEFGRLSGLSTTPNTGTPIGLNFVYDLYGNRWQQNLTAGSGPQPQLSFNTSTNQVIGYQYDAAGNVTNDGNHAYTYDAEGNLIAVDGGSTAKFSYDALNERVEAITAQGSERYGFDMTGRRSTSWNNSGGLDLVQYYAGVSPTAFWLAADSSIHFEHQDWLGTERMRTNSAGAVEGTYSSLPYGDGFTSSGTDTDSAHFALLDNDLGPSSGIEHADFREYSSTAGRWMSPDPYDGSYDMLNPQSLNRYSYALNNPLALIDPSGLEGCVDMYGGTEDNYSNVGSCNNAGYTWIDSSFNCLQHAGVICTITISYPSDPTMQLGGPGAGPGDSGGPDGAGNDASSATPNNAPNYTQADICTASTLLNKGFPTLLDAFGIFPGEGSLLKGAQAGAGLILAGIAVFQHGSATDLGLSGTGLGITAVDAGAVVRTNESIALRTLNVATKAGKGVGWIPVVGNIISAGATLNDIYGKEGINNYYNGCMAGKN